MDVYVCIRQNMALLYPDISRWRVLDGVGLALENVFASLPTLIEISGARSSKRRYKE